MLQLRLIKKHVGHFAAAHTLPFHDGGCANLHGHNYGLSITAIGSVNTVVQADHGMLVDFTVIKNAFRKRVHSTLDHSVIIADQNQPTWYQDFITLKYQSADHTKLIATKKVDSFLGKVAHLDILDTTAECLSEWIFNKMSEELEGMCEVYEVELYETDTSSAIYRNPKYGFGKITREEYENIQNWNPDGS